MPAGAVGKSQAALGQDWSESRSITSLVRWRTASERLAGGAHREFFPHAEFQSQVCCQAGASLNVRLRLLLETLCISLPDQHLDCDGQDLADASNTHIECISSGHSIDARSCLPPSLCAISSFFILHFFIHPLARAQFMLALSDAISCPFASRLAHPSWCCAAAPSSGDGLLFGALESRTRAQLTKIHQDRINLALGESLQLGPSEGKGYGVFATTDIAASTVLLQERPYLMPPPVAHELKQDVYTLFHALMSGANEGADQLLGWLFDALHCHRMALGPREEMLRKVFPGVRQLAESKLGPDARVSEISDDDMVVLYQAIRTNMQASGGLYVGCSFFNHSCTPNAVAASESQNDENYSVLSLVDIREGQEVTVPYIDFSAPVMDRQSSLLAMYGFRCDCPKCINELENLDILGGRAWTG